MARNDTERETPGGRGGSFQGGTIQYRDICGKCGARRIDRQIGLEASPEDYVAKMVEVFREVRRVLRDDGTVWGNWGDSYASSGQMGQSTGLDEYARRVRGQKDNWPKCQERKCGRAPTPDGLKPKDLCGIPWRVALALQSDGWYLRSDIIWAKPNPMPESVTDRPTKSHEYLFLLAKRERYYYDSDAVREPHKRIWDENNGGSWSHPVPTEEHGKSGYAHSGKYPLPNPAGRNRRSVWSIPTQAYPGAHFATFPPKLVEPCILAGTSAEGCCAKCGAPWVRITKRTDQVDTSAKGSRFDAGKTGVNGRGRVQAGERYLTASVGWEPSCSCNAPAVPCVVLDPFAGAGTTLLVAAQQGRKAIGIELSPAYCDLAIKRLEKYTNGLLPLEKTT